MSLSPVLKPDQDEAAETSVQQQHESTWNVEEPKGLVPTVNRLAILGFAMLPAVRRHDSIEPDPSRLAVVDAFDFDGVATHRTRLADDFVQRMGRAPARRS
jgi:hypothetical protein